MTPPLWQRLGSAEESVIFTSNTGIQNYRPFVERNLQVTAFFCWRRKPCSEIDGFWDRCFAALEGHLCDRKIDKSRKAGTCLNYKINKFRVMYDLEPVLKEPHPTCKDFHLNSLLLMDAATRKVPLGFRVISLVA